MPIYEYRCERCGVFEHTQRISEPALEKCPSCRKKVTRLISSTSFQLKGSGWYVTDYARKGTNGSKESGKANGTAGSGTTSESKPESGKSDAGKSETGKSAKSTTGADT